MIRGTFFQRGIKRFVPDASGRFIAFAELTCGHTVRYKQRRPITSRRKAMPCPFCGAGQRQPNSVGVNYRRLVRASCGQRRQTASGVDVPALLELLKDVIATPPVTEYQVILWDRVGRALSHCGALPSHDPAHNLGRTQQGASSCR